MTFGLARTSAGVSLGDDLAVVEDGDPVADAHDHPHVVLDEQDRQAELAPEAPDEVGHLARLAAVHAGGRLVEEQELGPGRQGAGDLEPALVAVGQVARPRLGPLVEVDELEQAHAFGDRRLLLAEHARGPQRPSPTSGS